MSTAHAKGSIVKRVRAAILLATVIVLFATAAGFTIYEVASFKAQLVRNVKTLAAVIADNSAASLTFENETSAIEVLSALEAEPDVEAAVLYDKDNRFFASYPPRLKPELLPRKLRATGYAFDSDGLVLFQPVMQEDKPIGTLYVRCSINALKARLINYATIVGFVLASSLAGAFILSRLLQNRITAPILSLSSTTRRIATQGDYTLRATKQTDDELGVLTDSFNHMLEQIEQREKALRESEQALRDQLNLVKAITDNTPSALYMLDDRNCCTFANPASEQISGFQPEELLGQSLHQVVHHTRPDGTPFLVEECPICRAGTAGTPLEGHEDTFIHKDGHYYPVRCNARPITREGGVSSTVLEVQDITDIVKARRAVAEYQQRLERTVQERTAALRDTVQQLETFSYSIVHDMRAPLRTMRSFGAILNEEEGERLTGAGRDYLRRIMTGAARLDDLINDVLTYSRVSKGEAKIERISLDQLVMDIVRDYPDLQSKAQHIEVQRPLPHVIGNTALLTQCVSNLLGNAIKFVPKSRDPRVVVRAEESDSTIRLFVEDNGIGIAKEYRSHLFGLFQRLNASNEFPGTGVGLAIVKRAVERMNGAVGFESEPGQGSTFWLELPKG